MVVLGYSEAAGADYYLCIKGDYSEGDEDGEGAHKKVEDVAIFEHEEH